METNLMPPETGNHPGDSQREQEKRGGGVLASLLSKLGAGGSAGGAAAGAAAGVAAGGAGWSSLGGGLLATKAGILALVVAGTTLGAGITIIGTERFGTSSGRRPSSFIFSGSDEGGEDEAAGAQAGAARADGVSDSLDYVSQANRGALTGEQAGAAEASSAAGALAPSAGPAAPDNTNLPANMGGGARPRMMAAKPFSTTGSGGFSGASASARGPSAAGGAAGLPKGFQAGKARRGGSGAARVNASGRKVSGLGGKNSAFNMAKLTNQVARGNLRANTSSAGSGVTYDGGRSALGSVGDGGIGGGGAGVGGAGAVTRGKTNPATDTRNLPPPPPPPEPKEVTPWKWAQYTAMGAMGVALIAFLAMNMFKNKAKEALAEIKTLSAIAAADITQATKAKLAEAVASFNSAMSGAKICAAVATAAGAVAAIMGITIMTAYGQTGQGLMWTAIGGLFTFMAASQWANLASMDELKVERDALAIGEAFKGNVAGYLDGLMGKLGGGGLLGM